MLLPRKAAPIMTVGLTNAKVTPKHAVKRVQEPLPVTIAPLFEVLVTTSIATALLPSITRHYFITIRLGAALAVMCNGTVNSMPFVSDGSFTSLLIGSLSNDDDHSEDDVLEKKK